MVRAIPLRALLANQFSFGRQRDILSGSSLSDDMPDSEEWEVRDINNTALRIDRPYAHLRNPFAKAIRLSSCSLFNILATEYSSLAFDGFLTSTSKNSLGVIPR